MPLSRRAWGMPKINAAAAGAARIFYAPAKLNLSLRVVGRRADGMHLLRGTMIPIDLCDRISIRPSPRARVRREWSHPRVAAGDDLAARAARLLRRAALGGQGAALAVQKNIPHRRRLGRRQFGRGDDAGGAQCFVGDWIFGGAFGEDRGGAWRGCAVFFARLARRRRGLRERNRRDFARGARARAARVFAFVSASTDLDGGGFRAFRARAGGRKIGYNIARATAGGHRFGGAQRFGGGGGRLQSAHRGGGGAVASGGLCAEIIGARAARCLRRLRTGRRATRRRRDCERRRTANARFFARVMRRARM